MMSTTGVRWGVLLALATTAALAFGGAVRAAPAQTQVLAVSVDGPGSITGPGINCQDGAGDCVETYATGTSVTLTAVPNLGATFTGWGGDCSGTATTCTFTMGSAKAVIADFVSGGGSTATLTVAVTGSGTVTGSGISCGNGATDCSETYALNTPVTLTATPAAGATFTGWGGSCSGTATTCAVTMSASKSVTATFSGGGSTATLTVTVTGGGRVTGSGIDCGAGFTDCSETYATNTSVVLSTIPSSGNTFSGWSGSCTGTATTCTVVMSSSRTVGATFTGSTTTTQLLTISVTGNGRVTGPGISCGSGFADCSEAYATNTSVTLTATPNAGAVFASWSGSCTGTATTCTVVMSAPRTAGAAFTTGATQTLTVSTTGGGRVTGAGINCGGNFNDCTETYPSGANVTLSIVRPTSIVFLGWGGACTGTATTCTVALDSSKNVSASFSSSAGNGNNTNTGRLAVFSLGNPLVVRTSVGWAVTIRFNVNQASAALLQLRYGGRLVNAFTFSPRRGNVLVGPFHLGRAGLYRFVLQLNNATGGSAQLIWNLCLTTGSGCSTFRPAGALVTRRGATYGRTSSGWLVRARFNANRPLTATVRMTRAGRTVASGTFAFRRGPVIIDLPTQARGTHVITMTARDSAGRRQTVRWIVSIR